MIVFSFFYKHGKVEYFFSSEAKDLSNSELIEFSFLGKLQIGPMVLCYFVFRFKSWDCFKLYFSLTLNTLNKELLDAKGGANSL